MPQRRAFHLAFANFFHPKFKQIFDIYTRSGFIADRRFILHRVLPQRVDGRFKKRKAGELKIWFVPSVQAIQIPI
jgi:hypothetical protein